MSKATRPIPLPQHLAAVFMLARRLEQRENNAARVDAQLYRFEARCMAEELQAAPTDDAEERLAPRRHGSHKSGKASKHGKRAVAKSGKYQRAQVYAKAVSSGSRRDKRARDDLDKLLGGL